MALRVRDRARAFPLKPPARERRRQGWRFRFGARSGKGFQQIFEARDQRRAQRAQALAEFVAQLELRSVERFLLGFQSFLQVFEGGQIGRQRRLISAVEEHFFLNFPRAVFERFDFSFERRQLDFDRQAAQTTFTFFSESCADGRCQHE